MSGISEFEYCRSPDILFESCVKLLRELPELSTMAPYPNLSCFVDAKPEKIMNYATILLRRQMFYLIHALSASHPIMSTSNAFSISLQNTFYKEGLGNWCMLYIPQLELQLQTRFYLWLSGTMELLLLNYTWRLCKIITKNVQTKQFAIKLIKIYYILVRQIFRLTESSPRFFLHTLFVRQSENMMNGY